MCTLAAYGNFEIYFDIKNEKFLLNKKHLIVLIFDLIFLYENATTDFNSVFNFGEIVQQAFEFQLQLLFDLPVKSNIIIVQA